MVDWSIRKDTVAEVENMSGPTLCTAKNPFDLFLDEIDRAEENNRIEVSLNGHIISQTCPRLS
jgi:hypothetical protein